MGLSPFHQDLGVGGFRGFTNLFVGPQYGETEWVPGGHGAAIERKRLPGVASYLVKGTPMQAAGSVEFVPWYLATFCKFARFWGVVLLLIVTGLAVMFFFWFSLPWSLVWLGAYLLALFLVVTRF